MNSKDKLVAALMAAGAPAEMIDRARNGYYSDFESPLPLPISSLVAELDTLKLLDLAGQARAGAFDATKEESDAWFQREGQAILKELEQGGFDTTALKAGLDPAELAKLSSAHAELDKLKGDPEQAFHSAVKTLHGLMNIRLPGWLLFTMACPQQPGPWMCASNASKRVVTNAMRGFISKFTRPEGTTTLVLELSREEFALLHTIGLESATGIARVHEVITRLIAHAQQGVYRPGAWEREWLCQAFGYEWTKDLEPGDPYGRPGCESIFTKPKGFTPRAAADEPDQGAQHHE